MRTGVLAHRYQSAYHRMSKLTKSSRLLMKYHLNNVCLKCNLDGRIIQNKGRGRWRRQRYRHIDVHRFEPRKGGWQYAQL